MNINQRKRGGGGIIESSSLNYTSQPQPLREQRNAVASVSRGVGIDGCRHPSPSGVNTLPTFWQAWIAIGCALVLWLFTYSFIVLVESWKRSYWMMLWRATWPWLGGLYVLSGYAHFTMRDDFCNIMPPRGTWGIWFLPGSAIFWIYFTGIVEIVAGGGLLISSLYNARPFVTRAGLQADCALVCLVLTIGVTPANIYMFTHGARMPIHGPVPALHFHLIRAIFQVVFLTELWVLAQPTIQLIKL